MNRFSLMSRRGFLLGSGIMLGGLGIAGATFVGSEESYAHLLGDEAPEVLSAREFVILEHFAETVISTKSVDAPSVKEARVARRIDRELVFHPGKLRSDIQHSLFYLEYSPPASGRLSRFTGMSAEEKKGHVTALKSSDDQTERLIYSGLRFLCIFFYYTDERTWPTIGYGGTFVEEKLFPAGNTLENLPPLNTHRTGRLQ